MRMAKSKHCRLESFKVILTVRALTRLLRHLRKKENANGQFALRPLYALVGHDADLALFTLTLLYISIGHCVISHQDWIDSNGFCSIS